MEIKKAAFTLSAPQVSLCPKDNKPEYAFIGRSNVGKSSLINMLCNHKGLAKTSATPGKTLLINHFIINNEWYIVDLPGYGFAKRSKNERKKLENMIRYWCGFENEKRTVGKKQLQLRKIRIPDERIIVEDAAESTVSFNELIRQLPT